MLLTELHNIELSVHEIGLSLTTDVFTDLPHLRVDCLWACLLAVKSWTHTFTELAPAECLGLTTITYLSMARCFIGLYRVSVFEHPDWDRALVRTHFDLVSFAGTVEEKFLSVRSAAGLDTDGSDGLNTFTILAAKIGRVRVAWDPNKAASTAADLATESQNTFDFSMELSDEDWLRDLVGPWN